MDVRDDISDEGSDEDLPYPILEDGKLKPGFVGWKAIEANSGLFVWDRLGEGYEMDVAIIGKALNTMFFDASLIYGHITYHLREYDLAIHRAFAYKVKTHTTNEDFVKVPYTFLTNPPTP